VGVFSSVCVDSKENI